MKIITRLSLLFIVSVVFFSCQKNYTKELKLLSQKLKSEGKQILYQTKNITSKEHEIIYVDGDKIMLNNIDSVSLILSGNSIITKHSLVADFMSDQELIVRDVDCKKDTLSKYLEDKKRSYYTQKEIQYQCINGDYILIGLNMDDPDSEKDLVCIKQPKDLYLGVKLTNKFDIDGNIIINIDGDMASYPNLDYDFPLLPDPLIFFRGACPFTWSLTIDKHGEIISKADEIVVHNIMLPLKDLTNGLVFSYKYMPLIERQIYISEQEAMGKLIM